MFVFATDDDVQLLSNTDYVYLDGTFKSASRPYLQFVTIHEQVNDFTLKLGNKEDEGKKATTKGKHKKSSASANSNVSMDESFSSRNRSYTDCDFLEQPVPSEPSSSSQIGLYRTSSIGSNPFGTVHVETGVATGIRVATDWCPLFNGE